MRSGAVVGSVLLHMAMLLVVIRSATGASFSAGRGPQDGDADAIEISLSGLSGLPASYLRKKRSPEEEQAAQMRELFRKVQAEHSEVVRAEAGAPKDSLAKLFEEINERYDSNDQDGATTKPAETAEHGDGGMGDTKGAADGASEAEKAAAKEAGGGASSLAAEELWGQVSPCWRKLPEQSRVPVKLEVTLDDRGMIAVPPRILRSETATLNEVRLVAESRAIAAIAACVPYKPAPPKGMRRVYTLTFYPKR